MNYGLLITVEGSISVLKAEIDDDYRRAILGGKQGPIKAISVNCDHALHVVDNSAGWIDHRPNRLASMLINLENNTPRPWIVFGDVVLMGINDDDKPRDVGNLMVEKLLALVGLGLADEGEYGYIQPGMH